MRIIIMVMGLLVYDAAFSQNRYPEDYIIKNGNIALEYRENWDFYGSPLLTNRFNELNTKFIESNINYVNDSINHGEELKAIIAYRDYFLQGLEALDSRNYRKAISDFKGALLYKKIKLPQRKLLPIKYDTIFVVDSEKNYVLVPDCHYEYDPPNPEPMIICKGMRLEFDGTYRDVQKPVYIQGKDGYTTVQKDFLLLDTFINISQHYIIPLFLSHAYQENGEYQKAIETILTYIYPSESFYSNILPNKDLAKKLEEQYGSINAAFIWKKDLQNKAYDFKKNGRPVYRDVDALIDVELLKLKVATIYKKWGDNLYDEYATDNEIKSKYVQILRIFPNYWNWFFKQPQPFNDSLNAEIVKLIFDADAQMIKLKYSLNKLGLPKNYIPLWNYTYLRQKAVEFINNARSLEKDLMTYLEKKQAFDEEYLILKQSVDLAQRNLDIQKSKIEVLNTNISIANANVTLARDRVKYKQQNIDGDISLQKVAKARNDQSIALAEANVGSSIFGAIANFANPANWAQGAGPLAAVTSAASGISNIYSATQSLSLSKLEAQFQEKGASENIARARREKKELESMEAISKLDARREGQQLEVAQKELESERKNVDAQQMRFDFFKSRPINGTVLYNMKEDVKKLLSKYMEYGIYLSMLAERAHQIEDLDTTTYIQNNYKPGKDLLSAEKLLHDLNYMEFSRIKNKKELTNQVTYIVPLRIHEPIGIEELRRTGKMSFNISEYDLDIAFPGTYRRLIDNIDIQIIGLTDVSGVKGRFTKEGLHTIKVPETYVLGGEPIESKNSSTAKFYYSNDWISTSIYSVLSINSKSETMVLPKQQNNLAKPDNEGLKRLFEGKGIGGIYTLELPKYSNNFDFNTIVDVIVKIDFSCYDDPYLKSLIENELCEQEKVTKFSGDNVKTSYSPYSFKENFPDDFYIFNNPVSENNDSRKQLFIPFYVNKNDFSPNRFDYKVNSLILNFIGKEGLLNLNCSYTSQALNSLKFSYENGQIILSDPSKDFKDLNWVDNAFHNVIDPGTKKEYFVKYTDILDRKAQLFDLWILKLESKDNSSFTLPNGDFDYNKINSISDVIAHFGYGYSNRLCEYVSRPYATTNIFDPILSFHINDGSYVSDYLIPFKFENANSIKENDYFAVREFNDINKLSIIKPFAKDSTLIPSGDFTYSLYYEITSSQAYYLSFPSIDKLNTLYEIAIQPNKEWNKSKKIQILIYREKPTYYSIRTDVISVDDAKIKLTLIFKKGLLSSVLVNNIPAPGMMNFIKTRKIDFQSNLDFQLYGVQGTDAMMKIYKIEVNKF